MQLVRSVVAKVSYNLQYCRSISNRQSRELCTSPIHKDDNPTKKLRWVLGEFCHKCTGLAIAYGPDAALGGASIAVGWYAHAYATDYRDSKSDKELNDLADKSELLYVEQKRELDQLDFLSEQYRILLQNHEDQNQKLEELYKQLSEQKQKNSTL